VAASPQTDHVLLNSCPPAQFVSFSLVQRTWPFVFPFELYFYKNDLFWLQNNTHIVILEKLEKANKHAYKMNK
jgi:hypothetical protein